MGPILHWLVGGPVSVKTLNLADWDQTDFQQADCPIMMPCELFKDQ